MKVLIINVNCGHGSTGVMVVEIAEMLERMNHQIFIAYGQGSTDFKKSFRIGTPLENKIHGLWNTRILGEEGTGTYCGTKKFLEWVDGFKPDVVHIMTLHSNFINYRLLFNYLKERQLPVVWSLYDCWPFTGKCTHFAEVGCRKWMTACKNCPQWKSSGPHTWLFDKSKKMFNQKKEWIEGLKNLDVITCSNWLDGEARQSILMNANFHMIYNWIDMAKFKEDHDDTIYERYGLDKNKKILVSVSAGWDDRTTRYADALRLSDILTKDYQLVIIGTKTSERELHDNMVHINYVNGTAELSKLYSCATAFVGFSVEDTFGKVFAEAMLCGTPAVVFNATACPEVVGDTGYAVERHDVKAMFEKVKEIVKNGREYYSERCKQRVYDRYTMESNVNKYIRIYENACR